MRILGLSVLLAISLFTPACGHDSKKKEDVFKPTKESCQAKAMLYYPGGCYTPTGIDQKTGRFSLLPYPKLLENLSKPELNVCVLHESFSAGKLLEVETNFEKAFNVWKKQIADLTPHQAYKLKFQTVLNSSYRSEDDERYFQNCDETSDLKISLQQYIHLGEENEDREHAKFFQGEMYLNRDSDYPVILHEMGHLFGLADIYVEDVWNCKEGFSNSVMCDQEWEKPVLDDIEAVRRAYCLASDGANEKCFNHVKTSLLSFVPNKIKKSKTEDFGTYIMCYAREFYFGATYNLVTMGRKTGAEDIEYQSGRFYSTDEQSVRETFEAGRYTVKIKSDIDTEENRYLQNPRDVTITLEDDVVTFQIENDLNLLRAKAIDCSFDTKFLAFLESRGVAVNAAIKARLPYQAFAEKVSGHSYYETPSSKVLAQFLNLGLEIEAQAELKIYADDENRTLVKTFKFADLEKQTADEHLNIYLPADHGLSQGTYHIFLAGSNSDEELVVTLTEAPLPSAVTATP